MPHRFVAPLLLLATALSIGGILGGWRGVGVGGLLGLIGAGATLRLRSGWANSSRDSLRAWLVEGGSGQGVNDYTLVRGGDLRAVLREEMNRASQRAQTLAEVIRRADEVVVAVDREGRVVAASSAAEHAFGVEPLEGKAFDDAATHEGVRSLVEGARRGSPGAARLRLSTPVGVRTFDASARPIEGGSGVLTMRDITELATAVQARTEFVANASHELRTPITAIRMSVETLTNEADADPMRARLLQIIASHARRLEEMVSDLLDLSRLESGAFRAERAPVAAADLLSPLQGLFEEACRERGLTIHTVIDPSAEALVTDARLVGLILRNLVENSTKFAYPESEIHVSLIALPERGARLEVVDRGIGIPLMHQARVFEPYFQVDPARSGTARRGTGLGLAIVRQAVTALGGTVRLRSVWKEGTTMTVDLPGAIAQRTGA